MLVDENVDPLRSRFASVEQVVIDPLRFKLRLGIGEDAYTSLRMKKNLQSLWDVGGMGATGAAAAASPVVASAFFAPAGFLGLIGLGTAVTPIGWIAAAAIASGGAYYGVMRLYDRYSGSRVDIIPKFINTPIDLLGATLFDLMGPLVVRVAQIDGKIDRAEIDLIVSYFVTDWGFDAGYVAQAIEVLVANTDTIGIKILAERLATFQVENPDCNPAAMRAEFVSFLRDVMEADGTVDEREQLAIDAIEAVMSAETNRSFQTAGRQITSLADKVVTRARDAAALLRPSTTRKMPE